MQIIIYSVAKTTFPIAVRGINFRFNRKTYIVFLFEKFSSVSAIQVLQIERAKSLANSKNLQKFYKKNDEVSSELTF